ncbi:hypothetical protein CIG75_15860 [Tumebacillus algifaecis]|uniref:Uncharacterized protein n=1 Tax=Tumebacillus algifaecis TaxID=1214604 RepID=A0A223D4C1_9BACL|nr:hypothetical protein [Tumebacillus algifaecis]ASS76273.1 hypothetical protein CIG75_15860 [Tumebacillus algifaecis]
MTVEMFDFKSALKRTKLNPIQKMTLSNRFKGREFTYPTEGDNIYEVAFGETVINIRAAETGLTPEEMDLIADVLSRARKNEQKAMIDMLTVIQVYPLAQETTDTLIKEWGENGVESKLIAGSALEGAVL